LVRQMSKASMQISMHSDEACDIQANPVVSERDKIHLVFIDHILNAVRLVSECQCGRFVNGTMGRSSERHDPSRTLTPVALNAVVPYPTRLYC
jgi:hypothetical protein